MKEVLVPEAKNLKKAKTALPKNAKLPQCNIYMSEEFYSPDLKANAKKTAVVLIQGTGAVRAGIWSRQVALKNDFDLGTMLPQVDWAINQKNFPVLIMNPNFNTDPKTKIPIPENESMEKHALHVWKNYVQNSGF